MGWKKEKRGGKYSSSKAYVYKSGAKAKTQCWAQAYENMIGFGKSNGYAFNIRRLVDNRIIEEYFSKNVIDTLENAKEACEKAMRDRGWVK